MQHRRQLFVITNEAQLCTAFHKRDQSDRLSGHGAFVKKHDGKVNRSELRRPSGYGGRTNHIRMVQYICIHAIPHEMALGGQLCHSLAHMPELEAQARCRILLGERDLLLERITVLLLLTQVLLGCTKHAVVRMLLKLSVERDRLQTRTHRGR